MSPARLLIATNNRFWRGSIGSNVRIASVAAHLRSAGWDVVVVFIGRAYPEDTAGLAAWGGKVWFTQPAATAASAPAASLAPSLAQRVNATLRAGLKRTHRLWRALRTQGGRPRPAGGLRAWWADLLLRSQEPQMADFADPRALQLMERVCKEHPPRVVLVEYLFCAWLVDALRPRLPASTAWVLDAHDVMHERQARFHGMGQTHGIDIGPREEAAWLSRFDAVMAIQSEDARKFRAIGVRAQVLTVMHPHPAGAVARQGGGPVAIGFMGSAMAPNTLALQELLRDIWPRVEQALGQRACLVVAGAVCASVPANAWPASARPMGHLAVVDDFYSLVDIVVSPLRIGGGLKIKNVEAMCKGRALVTTPIGAEGMDWGRDTPFVVAEAPADLAAALIRLVQNAPERDALAAAALVQARERFSEAAVYADLDAWLTQAVAAPA